MLLFYHPLPLPACCILFPCFLHFNPYILQHFTENVFTLVPIYKSKGISLKDVRITVLKSIETMVVYADKGKNMYI